MCGTLDLEKALERTFEYLKGVIPLTELRVNLLDRGLQAVKTIAAVDARGAREMIAEPEILPVSRAAIEQLAGADLPDVRTVGTMREDRATSDVVTHLADRAPESSLLIMRLVLDDRRLGALVYRAEGVNRYADEHLRLIGGLNEPFAIAVSNALTHHELRKLKDRLVDDNRYLSREIERSVTEEIVGAEFGLGAVMQMASSVAPLDSPVLLLGETGVGKEVIATAIHRTSERRDGPFIKLNCGTISPNLVDSELFGHERGAFTGAVAMRRGRFEHAAGGTLFLDEVGELPLDAQVRLLRVLQFHEFERVGGSETLKSDVRIIAATHRDLAAMVREGKFREDLWYRVNVFPILIPPLRQRRADIPALVHHFLDRKSKELGLDYVPALAEGAMEQLLGYSWPGNVRELENVIERALILDREGPLQFDSFAPPTPADAGGVNPSAPRRLRTLNRAVADHIRRALAHTGGRVGGPNGAAALLGINASTLRNRMKKIGVRYGRQSHGSGRRPAAGK